MIDPTIIAALFGFLGVTITAVATIIVAFRRTAKVEGKLQQAESEIAFQRQALAFPEFIEEWSEISKDIIELMKQTPVDRFLFLRATNGILTPRWATAFYQIRGDGQDWYGYHHVELDENYVAMLSDALHSATTYLVVDEMDDCLLKDIYQTEGVTASLLMHIASHHQKNDPRRVVQTYCTFATHQDTLLDPATITRCRVLGSRMKALAEVFIDNNEATSKVTLHG